MGVASDIFRSWRHPRHVMRDRLAAGVREDRALAYLMIACLLIFVGQWPMVMRNTQLGAEVGTEAKFAGSLFAWLFVVPLGMYFLAAISHLLAKLAGGQGSWFAARMALFWSLLAVAPIWMLNSLIARSTGSEIVLKLAGALALAAFIVVWISSLIEAERGSLTQ